jgi:hypothetical protein
MIGAQVAAYRSACGETSQAGPRTALLEKES